MAMSGIVFAGASLLHREQRDSDDPCLGKTVVLPQVKGPFAPGHKDRTWGGLLSG